MNTTMTLTSNERLVMQVIQELWFAGVEEFVLCPGVRNAPFVQALATRPDIKQHYWFEERSAGFFALGRCRSAGKPVAVITTSGTASAELLPATIEAYYTGVPLLLVTADRPPHYRGTGAPQVCEQVDIFGVYAEKTLDITSETCFSLQEWKQRGPAHINVCLEDRDRNLFQEPLEINQEYIHFPQYAASGSLDQFYASVKNPFVVLGTVPPSARHAVIEFLVKLNAPVYAEAISGIRGDPRISHLEICVGDNVFNRAKENQYPIDGVLRIGGVPTFRSWRDLEELEREVAVYSVNYVPFSGLSFGHIVTAPLDLFFKKENPRPYDTHFGRWLETDKANYRKMLADLKPEPSMVRGLSLAIPEGSMVYLGNSLPIREWDMAAVRDKKFEIQASRGINGIDGQLSTFFGLCEPGRDNWGIFGDLTTLYDLAAPWILRTMQDRDITIVVINNGGGMIFAPMFKEREILNEHQLSFEPVAKLWGLQYSREITIGRGHRLIELRPE